MKELLSTCATGGLGVVVAGGLVTTGVTLYQFFCCSSRKPTTVALANHDHAQAAARIAAKERFITLKKQTDVDKATVIANLQHFADYQAVKVVPSHTNSTIYSSTNTMFAQLSQKNQWLSRYNHKQQTMWQTLNDAINQYPTAHNNQFDTVESIEQFHQDYSNYHDDVMQLAMQFFEESEQLMNLKVKLV